MDIAGFRERLATIAGEERFWQIVASLNHTGRWKRRFLYWQEILLAEADVVAPSPAELFDLVEPCLQV